MLTGESIPEHYLVLIEILQKTGKADLDRVFGAHAEPESAHAALEEVTAHTLVHQAHS